VLIVWKPPMPPEVTLPESEVPEPVPVPVSLEQATVNASVRPRTTAPVVRWSDPSEARSSAPQLGQ
jgi:hypothetical protein